MYRATSNDIYKKVGDPLIDSNGRIQTDSEGNPMYASEDSNEKFTGWGAVECSYNCTGNALTNQKFTIGSGQITEDFRKEEGLVNIEIDEAKKGDIGLYIVNSGKNAGLVTHLEPFLTKDKVSTKGGVGVDEGPVDPGQSQQFSENASYQVVTKKQYNTTITKSNVGVPWAGSNVKSSIPKKSSTNGVNRVSNSQFAKTKKDVKTSQSSIQYLKFSFK